MSLQRLKGQSQYKFVYQILVLRLVNSNDVTLGFRTLVQALFDGYALRKDILDIPGHGIAFDGKRPSSDDWQRNRHRKSSRQW